MKAQNLKTMKYHYTKSDNLKTALVFLFLTVGIPVLGWFINAIT